jgi:hypothetical protein
VIKVEISGLADVAEWLKTKEAKVSGEILRQVFTEGANTIAQTERNLAPSASGFLRSAIEVRSSRRKDMASARIVIDEKKFPKYPYARAVNAGHYAGRRGNLLRPWIQGRHFVEDAARQHYTDVPTTIVETLRQKIESE